MKKKNEVRHHAWKSDITVRIGGCCGSFSFLHSSTCCESFSCWEMKRPVCVLSQFTCIWLLVTLWTVACQAPLSMGFSRQEHWSGLPGPYPRALSDSAMAPTSPVPPALAGRFFTSTTREALKDESSLDTKPLHPCTDLGDSLGL